VEPLTAASDVVTLATVQAGDPPGGEDNQVDRRAPDGSSAERFNTDAPLGPPSIGMLAAGIVIRSRLLADVAR
jgi:hypothetical protein